MTQSQSGGRGATATRTDGRTAAHRIAVALGQAADILLSEGEPEGSAGFDPRDVARINRRTDHLMGNLSWQGREVDLRSLAGVRLA